MSTPTHLTGRTSTDAPQLRASGTTASTRHIQQFFGLRGVNDAIHRREDRCTYHAAVADNPNTPENEAQAAYTDSPDGHYGGGELGTDADLSIFQLSDPQFSVVSVIRQRVASAIPRVVDEVEYDPYGVARRTAQGDFNHSGTISVQDIFDVLAAQSPGDYSADEDDSGNVGPGDINEFLVEYFAADPTPADRISSRIIDNPYGYCGYVADGETAAAKVLGPRGGALYSVRFRTHDPIAGRWLTRDPAGFVDGMNLYEYCRGRTTLASDPAGMWGSTRLWGAVKLVGGLAEATAGFAFAVATGGIGTVVGGAVVLHGLDGAFAGATELISGSVAQTGTSWVVQHSAMGLGMAGSDARTLGDSVNTALSLLTILFNPTGGARGAAQLAGAGGGIHAILITTEQARLLTEARVIAFGGALLRLMAVLGEYDSGVIAEAMETGAISNTTPQRAGTTRPPRHHVFPQDGRDWFSDRGIDIDDFVITLDQGTHEALHYGGGPGNGGGWWNQTIMKTLKELELRLKRNLYPDEIIRVGRDMTRRANLGDLPFEQCH